MKKFILLILIIIFPLNVFADSGSSTIVMDNDSGRIIYENNINDKRLIASITKIMTCILTIENADLNKKIVVGEEILDMYGTNIYIQVGEEISIKDLLYGLMLRSGNDAAIVLSNNVFDNENEFIKQMNKKAKEIGMKNTTFNNSHGLDEDTKNYSTAYDMAILARYSYKNKIFKKIISTKRYIARTNIKTYEWYNRMSLINSYKYCIGGKNGYTPKAGKTLVSYASKNNLNLIIVSLDDSDIYINHKNLYNKFFNNYSNYTILDKNKYIVDSSIIKKKMYLKQSFIYPLKEDEIKRVSTIVQIYNDNTGKIIIKLSGNKIGEVRLYSKNKKEDKNIFHYLKKLFI